LSDVAVITVAMAAVDKRKRTEQFARWITTLRNTANYSGAVYVLTNLDLPKEATDLCNVVHVQYEHDNERRRNVEQYALDKLDHIMDESMARYGKFQILERMAPVSVKHCIFSLTDICSLHSIICWWWMCR
jgi:hypothetical protein